MPAYWEGLPAGTSDVATSVVGTAERALGLLAEEAALRRNRPRTAAASRSRGPRPGAKDEAATAVETAAKGQGNRHRRSGRGSGHGAARRDRAGHSRGQQQGRTSRGTEL